MRLRVFGVSAVFGTTVALLAAVVLALPRDTDRGARHNAVRATRGAMQRFDSTESPAHFVEDPEAVLDFAADGVGDFTLHAPPGDGGLPAVVAAAEPRCPLADAASVVRLAPPPDIHARSCCTGPVLGRAPPIV
jgi:hypothetical protein